MSISIDMKSIGTSLLDVESNLDSNILDVLAESYLDIVRKKDSQGTIYEYGGIVGVVDGNINDMRLVVNIITTPSDNEFDIKVIRVYRWISKRIQDRMRESFTHYEYYLYNGQLSPVSPELITELIYKNESTRY